MTFGDTGPEVVDVEVVLNVPTMENALSVFLYHPNEDRRIEAEAAAWACGAKFTTHPGPVPAIGSGSVRIANGALYVSIGQMYVISPLTLKSEETV